MTNCRFISLALAAVDVPASKDRIFPPSSYLAAFAMLIAERDNEGDWTFTLESHATAAGDGEDALLVWATGAMPETGVVLGWQLAEQIIPPLLDGGTAGDPEIGRAFLDRLMALVTAPSVDLALAHGGAGAPVLNAVVVGHGIALEPMAPSEIESAWAFGDRERLRAHVETHAIATWRLWLAEANGTAATACEAFAFWLDRRVDRDA